MLHVFGTLRTTDGGLEFVTELITNAAVRNTRFRYTYHKLGYYNLPFKRYDGITYTNPKWPSFKLALSRSYILTILPFGKISDNIKEMVSSIIETDEQITCHYNLNSNPIQYLKKNVEVVQSTDFKYLEERGEDLILVGKAKYHTDNNTGKKILSIKYNQVIPVTTKLDGLEEYSNPNSVETSFIIPVTIHNSGRVYSTKNIEKVIGGHFIKLGYLIDKIDYQSNSKRWTLEKLKPLTI